jgi:hypothetical protein
VFLRPARDNCVSACLLRSRVPLRLRGLTLQLLLCTTLKGIAIKPVYTKDDASDVSPHSCSVQSTYFHRGSVG